MSGLPSPAPSPPVPGPYPSLVREFFCFSPSHSAAIPSSPRALAARSRLLRCRLLVITWDRLLQQAAVRRHFTKLREAGRGGEGEQDGDAETGPRTNSGCPLFRPSRTSGPRTVDLISDKQGSLLQVPEWTGRLHHDLAQKVHPGIFQGIHAEAQVCQMSVAHECKAEEATASHVQAARV